ncbi:hypothetical protein AX16_005826 [Volvariella volvacea WC 439]|nr:hypothetical protein AX16_005826 [Volvariella volvacea WC 439]
MTLPSLDLAVTQFKEYSNFVQLAVLAGGGLLLYYVYGAFASGLRHRGMPPGPRALPFFGNALTFPRERPHLKFTEWAREYGDIFSLKVFQLPIIVLNSPSAVREVFEKHSWSTSNRPKSTIADMITPNDMNLGTGHTAGETWKILRKPSAQSINNENLRKKKDLQRAEAVQLMWEFCHDPENWYEHIPRYTTSFAMAVIYGSRGTNYRSKDIAEFLHVQRMFMNALEFGTAPPVDIFPILKYIPERWAGWKRTANHVRKLHEELYERLLVMVEKRLARGLSADCFMEDAVQNAKDLGLTTRELLTNIGGTLLEGSDTTSATLQGIALCLVSFPEAQKKIRAEIDRVVGNQRTPRWDDIPNLPYLNAFIEEVLRYRPVANLGLPHEMVQDEVIDGYFYPKGTVLFMNLRRIFHDEKYFDRPDQFIPERFLKHPLGVRPDVEDDPARKANLLFGGGRRVCPGVTFAKTSMEMNLALWVWAFDFLPHIDPKTGKEVFPDLDKHSPGITAIPDFCPIRIKPRSQNHIDLIQKEFTSVAEHLAPYELDLPEEDRRWNAKYRDI